MNPTHNSDHESTGARLLGWLNLADGLPTLIGKPDPADRYQVTEKGRRALETAPAADPGTRPDTTPSTCPVDLVTETDDEVTARVLRSAAVYLERHGWVQGAYYDATSRLFTPAADMVGAIAMVCYGGPCEAPAQHFDDPGFLDFEAAVLHLDRYLLAEDGSEVYEFNDAKGRRLEDVLRVLRDAASRPAHELVDALRVIDAKNADLAALADMLKPCGIFGETAEPQPVEHVDYPHTPGTLYDCPACEAECFCTDGFQCVHCALEAEQNTDGGADGGDAR